MRLRLKKKSAKTPARQGDVEGALLALDPATGMVRALVGGYDFATSQYNRALQAKRQPGSSFKPIYIPRRSSGLDGAVGGAGRAAQFPPRGGKVWAPQNYDNKFHGPVTLRTALGAFAQQRLGASGAARRRRADDPAGAQARIASPIEKNLSLALGSPSVTLLEMVRAFGVFAGAGKLAEPLFILKVTDRDGSVLEENEPSVKPALSPEVAYVMTDMLKNVVQSGTARAAAKLGKKHCGKKPGRRATTATTGSSATTRVSWPVFGWATTITAPSATRRPAPARRCRYGSHS
jgi:penicillin-binding protein 1A